MLTLLLLAKAAVLLVLAMSGAWAIQWLIGNAGWVDVVWTFATGAVGVLCALVPVGDGPPGGRRVAVAAVAAVWALRLGFHLAHRVSRGPEDSRYAAFRREWGAAYQRRMFWFLQIQAAAALVLVLTVLAAAHSPGPFPRVGDIAAIVVLVVALGGEALADAQLRRFRADPANHGRVCDTGLWRWSRHPNYFCEWLVWLAYPLFAAGGYWAGWFTLAGPVLMYWLLVHVSGIPPLEAQMLKSRGDAFRAYQARTSPFVPWPRRGSAAS